MKTSASPLLRRADHSLEELAPRRRLAWPLLALLLLPALGTAATRTVTSLADGGLGSLRDTIASSSPGDTIVFSVTGAIVLTSGELVVGKDLRINGPGAASLHVSGNFASRVFRVPIGVVAIISDIDIANGSAVGPDGAVGAPNRPGQAGTPGRGGGIFNAGNLTLSKCIVQHNLAWGGRGGNGGQNGGGVADPDGVYRAGAGGNGGSGEGGGVYSEGSLSVTNCSFFNNQCLGSLGGQGADGTRRFGAGSPLEIQGAKGGGGGDTRGNAICHLGFLTIVNSTFTQNSAQAGAGGAGGEGALGFDGAAGGGGGNGGDSSGGAIWVLSAMAVNCTIVENSVSSGAGGNGGAPVCDVNPCRPGSAGTNGQNLAAGLYQAGAGGAILNTILALNGADGTVLDVSGTVTSLGHNLIGHTSGSSGWLASDLQNPSPFDVQLGPLQINGGPVPTMALLPASIAIDAADDAVLSPPYSLMTDARGFARRTSDHVDIGAFEFSTLTRLVTTTSDSGGGSLRNAIAIAGPLDRILFAPLVRGKIRLTSGELVINKPLSIVGPGAPVLAISGNTNSRVFHIGPQGNADIYALTITEGRVVGTNGANGVASGSGQDGESVCGGGVFNEGFLTLSDCMITTNGVAGGQGGKGGVFANLLALVGNGGAGGGGFGSGIYNSAFLELRRCALLGNAASGGSGGAGGVNAANNRTGNGGAGGLGLGGGVYEIGSSALEDCTVSGNQTTGGRGGNGGLANSPSSPGPGNGGNGGAAQGGALRGAFGLSSCTIAANTSLGGAGGSHNALPGVDGVPGSVDGGGVFATTSLAVLNTLIAGNTGSVTSPDVNGAVTSHGWNLIGITDGSSGWMLSDLLGNAMFPLNPLLGACQDNGGPVWTMGLLAGSPARDKGRSGLATDARGGPRIVDFPNVPNASGGDGSDIGALEVDSLFGAITITFYAVTNSTTSGFALVRFKSDSGTTYRLQQTSAVTNRVWTNIVGTVTGNGQDLSAIDFGPFPTARFYRVRAD